MHAANNVDSQKWLYYCSNHDGGQRNTRWPEKYPAPSEVPGDLRATHWPDKYPVPAACKEICGGLRSMRRAEKYPAAGEIRRPEEYRADREISGGQSSRDMSTYLATCPMDREIPVYIYQVPGGLRNPGK